MYFGTSWGYLCNRKQKHCIMVNTEYNLDFSAIVSSETSIETLLDIISDMGLEVTEVGRS